MNLATNGHIYVQGFQGFPGLWVRGLFWVLVPALRLSVLRVQGGTSVVPSFRNPSKLHRASRKTVFAARVVGFFQGSSTPTALLFVWRLMVNTHPSLGSA